MTTRFLPTGLRRQLALHLGLTGLVVIVLMLGGWGDIASFLTGSMLMLASFLVQGLSTAWALGRHRRPRLAAALLFLKIPALAALAWLARERVRAGPMSFVTGVTVLLLAIVVDACYAASTRGDGDRPQTHGREQRPRE